MIVKPWGQLHFNVIKQMVHVFASKALLDTDVTVVLEVTLVQLQIVSFAESVLKFGMRY